jgi:hypothetical protein
MVAHFGHFTHKPSGISFLRAFELESFGFLTKPVFELGGGGVTAGSTLSTPSDFLVNDVVAIFFKVMVLFEMIYFEH